ncbi:MAG TPA: BsuBI/PstI family type II restriction endonuclease [Acidobacteriota bacterium]|nr:BsuBI/PstI family type II restriction endonuclease [Acidobacteriota bacterium]
MSSLPPFTTWQEIHRGLQMIFPGGSPNRAHSVWEISAKTVFVMLYVGAVEGRETWARPNQITRMTDEQASQTDDVSRQGWAESSMESGKGEIPGRWYADNTRESIRDDTIRYALIPNGAVIEREGLAPTSPQPRYALASGFAELLDPGLKGPPLAEAMKAWRADNLSAGALARIAIRRKGAATGGEHVMVRFPNGEARRMSPGPSSHISKAVVEEFASRFLGEPGVIWLSESRNKVVARDDELAREIGLSIQPDRNLPDIILVDLAPRHPLLVFIEVVATDGPVSEERKSALTSLAEDASFPGKHLAFVTAFLDRSEAAYKKTADNIAWGTFAWFATEPSNLLFFYRGSGEEVKSLSDWTQDKL